ncbi:hypothetical protein QJQ45_021307 [Haematococcus lacustris]|nr:hypothetical protein QJQ45_021307 [Haematococcus lacustris]
MEEVRAHRAGSFLNWLSVGVEKLHWRIGESVQRPIELCQWDDLEALPAIGKEYQQGYKRVNDRLPKKCKLHTLMTGVSAVGIRCDNASNCQAAFDTASHHLSPASFGSNGRVAVPIRSDASYPGRLSAAHCGEQHGLDMLHKHVDELSTLVPFMVADVVVGHMKPKFAAELARFPDVFVTTASTSTSSSLDAQGGGAGLKSRPELGLNLGLATLESRTQAVAGVLAQLRGEGLITGWRDELYPVTPSYYAAPLMLVERAAATHFGIKAYGVHVNGFVRHQDGSHSLWVARRSISKPNWPGKLDHLVAGGQPHGLSPTENVVKECWEEAGVAAHLADAARPVGVVSYRTGNGPISSQKETQAAAPLVPAAAVVSATGLKPDVLFVYDLELPEDFKPQAQDGEVEQFMLWPVSKVAEVVSNTTEFKTNCNLVIIDWLVRHGYITPEQPGYLDVVKGLRQGDCS